MKSWFYVLPFIQQRAQTPAFHYKNLIYRPNLKHEARTHIRGKIVRNFRRKLKNKIAYDFNKLTSCTRDIGFNNVITVNGFADWVAKLLFIGYEDSNPAYNSW